ncbi:MAG: hypothetical protein HC880_17185 [Bacteroidia bacterium]|nr:hypothetical protein [Bacteroidia bacterium]
MEKIVVFGGTGTVGKYILSNLNAKGIRPLISSRNEKPFTGTFTVTGENALTFEEASRQLSEGLAVPINFVDLSPDQFKAGLAQANLPDDLIHLFSEGFRAVRAGLFDFSTTHVKDITGREPTKLKDFAQQMKPVFEQVAKSPQI